MPNATAYWPSVNCFDQNQTTPLSCNGDRNGLIEYLGNKRNEYMNAWVHLKQSKLLVINYYNHNGWGTDARYLNDDKTLMSLINWGANTPLYNNQNFINANKLDIYGDAIWNFSPVDVYAIDNKMDDGNPSDGRIISYGYEYGF